MQYELDCECGNKILVRETAAGAKEQCQCGRRLVIPSLHELRQRAGLPIPELPPEKVVETLLLAGQLPQEDNCIFCGTATDDFICCTTECEKAYIQSGRPGWWVYLLSFLTLGWMGAAVVYACSSKEDREWGKDRVFTLPLRVCVNCRHHLIGPSALKESLERVPLYRRLLEKYPDARITLSSQ